MMSVPSPETMKAADLYGEWLGQLNKLADQEKGDVYDRAWKEAVLALLAKIAIGIESKS